MLTSQRVETCVVSFNGPSRVLDSINWPILLDNTFEITEVRQKVTLRGTLGKQRLASPRCLGSSPERVSAYREPLPSSGSKRTVVSRVMLHHFT